jgi:hypothetical protein
MFQILNFIARGIRIAQEFDVNSGIQPEDIEAGPAATLKINVTDNPPDRKLPTIYYEDYYYSVNDTIWAKTTFRLLSVLFQTAVGKIENVGIPITIAK